LNPVAGDGAGGSDSGAADERHDFETTMKLAEKLEKKPGGSE